VDLDHRKYYFHHLADNRKKSFRKLSDLAVPDSAGNQIRPVYLPEQNTPGDNTSGSLRGYLPRAPVWAFHQPKGSRMSVISFSSLHKPGSASYRTWLIDENEQITTTKNYKFLSQRKLFNLDKAP
jgi:hypothetical protein